jgi:hypothetical protein
MLGRLGQVLYWAAIGTAVIVELFGWALVIFSQDSGNKFFGGLVIVCGVIIFGMGRACLYILAGR